MKDAGNTKKGISHLPEEQEIDPVVDMAIERTELALERTNLAWIRTVIVLISSGFAIDKLVEVFHRQRMASGEAWVKQAHVTGLSITIAGTLLMIIESIYYVGRSRELSQLRDKRTTIPIGTILSFLVVLLGSALVYLMFASHDWGETGFPQIETLPVK